MSDKYELSTYRRCLNAAAYAREMSALDQKETFTKHFQTTGLFQDLESFANLEGGIERLGPNGSRTEEQHRGDAFEVFAEAYIAVKHGATDVYPEQEIPAPLRDKLKLPPTDKGVDGICKMPGGEIHGYQVKFRTNRKALTWDNDGLSKFAGLPKRTIL